MLSPRVKLSRFRRKFSGKSLPTVAVVYAGIKGSFGLDIYAPEPLAYVDKWSGLGKRLKADAEARQAIVQACYMAHIVGKPIAFRWIQF